MDTSTRLLILTSKLTKFEFDNSLQNIPLNPAESGAQIININHKNWMKNFDPKTVEDLAVNNKKIQEMDEWMKTVYGSNNSDMLLLTGPVGCGKTASLRKLADKYHIKVTEWITPIDIEIPSEYGKFFMHISMV